MRRGVAISSLLTVVLASGSQQRVGVCWTRNNVKWKDDRVVEPLDYFEVYFSLLSLRAFHASVGACLFTEPSPKAVHRALEDVGKSHFPMSHQRVTFDYVVPSANGLEIIEALTTTSAEAVLAGRGAAREGLNLWEKVKALVARIENLAHSPFEITLFLDTDTAFCPAKDTRLLSDVLSRGYRRDIPVRIAELISTKGKASHLNETFEGETRVLDCVSRTCPDESCLDGHEDEKRAEASAANCLSCFEACEDFRSGDRRDACPSFLGSPVSLQAGAILYHRSEEARRFVSDWVAEYINVFVEEKTARKAVKKTFGNDQVPLNGIVSRHCANRTDWRVAHLPNGFNCRLITPSARGIVNGRIYVLHQHGLGNMERKDGRGALHRISQVCSILNAHSSPRFVSNAHIKEGLSSRKHEQHVTIDILPLEVQRRTRRRRA